MSPCAKCGGSMEQGFVVDHTYGGREVSSWVEGEPEKSFWQGISMSDRAVFPVKTWRCTRCGCLESYATL